MRCSSDLRSCSSSSLRTLAANFLAAASVSVASTAGALRNQVAITGTMVKDTNSEATNAKAKVSANGLNS